MKLEQVLAHARTHSPSIARAQARVSLGTAQIQGAEPLLPENPVVSAALGARFNPLGRSFEAQLQIWQPFEIAGERRQRIAAGRAAEHARQTDVDEMWWMTEVEIRAAFMLALVARETVEAQASAVEFAERMVAAFELRVQTGDLAPLDLRIAETEVADARQQLLELELEYRNTCVRLAALAGWPTGAAIEPIGDLPTPVEIGGQELREMVEEHPSVLSAEADIDVAAKRLKAAKRDAWPHPALGVYMAHEQEPGTPFASRVGLLTLTIPMPVWQRNQGQRAEAHAELTVAKADAGALKYELGRQLEAQLNAVRFAARRVETYSQEVLPRFSENLRMLERAFELGEIDLLQVLVGQQRFVSQQRRALEIYGEYVEAVRRYELVAGQAVSP
ncbi:MAG: TolC family protein [Enhygromyxa sp.]